MPMPEQSPARVATLFRLSHPKKSLALVLAGMCALLAGKAEAANETWTQTTNGAWTTGTWSGGAGIYPGSTTAGSTTNTDTATFGYLSGVGSGTVTVSLTGTLNLDALVVTGTSSYNVGSGGTFVLTNGGYMSMATTATLQQDTISGNVILAGATGTLLSSGSGANNLISGNVTGMSSGTSTLYLGASGGTTGTITLSGAIANGTSGLLNTVVDGTNWILTGANSYTGTTTISGTQGSGFSTATTAGTLKLSGASGAIASSNQIFINGGGTLFDGDTTTVGLANRLSSTATLTIGGYGSLGADQGGGAFTLNGAASGSGSNNQTIAAINIVGGQNTISTVAGTTTSTLTITGAGGAGYTRSAGSIVNFSQGGTGSFTFTNAPTSSVSGGILLGAVLNGNGFISAAANQFTNPTETSTYSSGVNWNPTASPASTGTYNVNSLLFSTGAFSIGLSGTNYINSGGIIVGSGATSGAITGGTLEAGTSSASGGELWIYLNGKPLTISSTISDGTSPTSLTLGGASAATSTLTLSGSNNYSGATTIDAGTFLLSSGAYLGSGTVTVNNPSSLSSSGSTTLTNNGTIGGSVVLNTGAQGSNTGTISGNVTVGQSTGLVSVSAGTLTTLSANFTNNGTISGTLTTQASAVGILPTVNGNVSFVGSALLNGGSTTGNIVDNGALLLNGSTAITTGTISTTSVGGSGTNGVGSIFNAATNSNTLTLANGSNFFRYAPAQGSAVTLTTPGTAYFFSFGQTNNSSTNAIGSTTTLGGGTFDIGQFGQSNTGQQFGGTLNILNGSTVNITTTPFSGAAGGVDMHGIYNVGGASSGTLTSSSSINEGNGDGTAPTNGGVDGLQITVGNTGSLSVTGGVTLGLGTALSSGVNQSSFVNVSGGTGTITGALAIAGTLADAGTESNSVTVSSGTLGIGGATTLGVTAMAATNITDSLTVSGGVLTNVGNLTIGTATVPASINNNVVTLSSGKMFVTGTLTTANTAGSALQNDSFVWSGGQLTALAVGSTTAGNNAGFNGNATGNSLAYSGGSLTLTNNYGTLAPGDTGAAGKTTINGNYTQGSGGTLSININIGGTTAATTFSTLGAATYSDVAVTGAASLGGNLSLAFFGTGSTTIGSTNTLTILTGASVTGSFTDINPDGRINVSGGGSFYLATTSTSVLLENYGNGSELYWAGTTSNVWDTSTSNWASTNGATGSVTFANSSYLNFTDSAHTTSVVLTNTTTLQPAQTTFENNTNTYNLSGSGAISGSGDLVMNGTGTVVIGTANSYSGGTNLNAGTTELSGAGTLGSSNGPLTMSGTATLTLNGDSVAVDAFSGGVNDLVNNNNATTATLTVGSNNSAGTFSGTLANGATGTLAFTKNGTGTVNLNGSETYSGNTTVNSGLLVFGGSFNSTGSLVLNGNTGSAVTFNNTSASSAGGVYFGSTSTGSTNLTVGGGSTAPVSLGPINATNATSGSILDNIVTNGSGSVTIGSITGTLNTLNDTSATATTTIAQSNGASGYIATVTGTSGSVIKFAGDGTGNLTLAGPLGASGQTDVFSSGTVNVNQGRHSFANITVNGGELIFNNSTLANSRLGLDSYAGGTQTLTISSGTLLSTSPYGLRANGDNGSGGAAPNTGSVIINQTGGVFTLSGGGSANQISLGSSGGGGNVTYNQSGGVVNDFGNGVGTGSITLGADTAGAQTTSYNFSGGTLNSNAGISGSQGAGAKQSFVWTGGTLSVAGYNATNLTSTAGTAVVAGTVNTLANTGSGTLAPGEVGTAGETIITGNYSQGANATLAIDLGGTTQANAWQSTATGTGYYDYVSVTNTATLGGTLALSTINSFTPTTGTFNFLTTAASGVSGTFATVTYNGTNFSSLASETGKTGSVYLLPGTNGLDGYTLNYGTGTVALVGAANTYTGANGSAWDAANAADWSVFDPGSGAAGSVANFADGSGSGTGSNTVTLSSARSVQGISFTSTKTLHNYTINGTGTITLDNTGNTAAAFITDSSAGGNSNAINTAVALNSNLLVSVASTSTTTNTLTLGGVISGSGKSVTNNGTGALVLGNANSFSGGVTQNAGTLDINNAGALGSGTFTLAGGAIDNTSGSAITTGNNAQAWNSSFTFNGSNGLNLGTGAVTLGVSSSTVTVSSNTLTVGGSISGTNDAITKAGIGALVLSGSNTFSGGLTQNAGTLDINNAGALGSGTFTLAGGAIDNTSGSAITTGNNAQAWNSSFTFNGSNALNLGTGSVTLGVSSSTVTVSSSTLTVGGAISGSGDSLTKAGNGALVLGGNSTFSGGVNVNAGTLFANNSGALGTGAAAVNGGATLALQNGVNLANTLSLTGTGYSGGALNNVAGSNTLSGSVYLGGNATINTAATSTLTFASTGDLTIGNASGGADYTLTLTGPGTVNLLGTLTDNGANADGLSVKGSTLVIGNGTGSVMSSLAVFNATLALSSGEVDFNNGNGNTAFNGYTITVSGGLLKWLASDQLLSAANISVSSGTVNFNGYNESINNLTNSGGTVLYGTGTVSFADPTWSGGVNTVTGNTSMGALTISAGTNTVQSGGILTVGGTSPNLDFTGTLSPNLTLQSDNTTPGKLVLAGDVTVDSSVTTGTASITSSGTATDAGVIDMDTTGTARNFTVANSGASLLVSAEIIDSGTNSGLNKAGNGTMILTQSEGYTGPTSISAGTLQLGNGGTSGALSASSAITDNGNLAIDRSNAVSQGTDFTSSPISGNGSLTLNGTGTTTLSANNTFSGGTTLASGGLIVSNSGVSGGSATGTGNFTMAGGTTLAGAGAINASQFALGSATAAQAVVTVGNGTDATSGLTLTGSSASTITNVQLAFNISATSPGQANVLNVGGSQITFSNTTLELNVQGLAWIGAYTPYLLIQGTGSGQYLGLTTTMETLNGVQYAVITDPSALQLAWSQAYAQGAYGQNSVLILNTNGGADDIEVLVVPEPSTWAMIIGGLAALIVWQRRRRQG